MRFKTISLSVFSTLLTLHVVWCQCDPDEIEPIFQITNSLGIVLADNNIFTVPGTFYNFGETTLLDGECSIVHELHIDGVDQCDGVITHPNAVTVVSTTNFTNSESLPRVTISSDFEGAYLLTIAWAVGQSEVVVGMEDSQGNQATVTVFRSISNKTQTNLACLPQVVVPLDNDCKASVSPHQLLVGLDKCFDGTGMQIQIDDSHPVNMFELPGAGRYRYYVNYSAGNFYCGGIILAQGFGANTSCNDQDSDGVADAEDNCPSVSNRDQTDRNGNGIGDACEQISGNDGYYLANTDGDFYVGNSARGIVMRAIDGTCYRISLNPGGNLDTKVIDCPK